MIGGAFLDLRDPVRAQRTHLRHYGEAEISGCVSFPPRKTVAPGATLDARRRDAGCSAIEGDRSPRGLLAHFA